MDRTFKLSEKRKERRRLEYDKLGLVTFRGRTFLRSTGGRLSNSSSFGATSTFMADRNNNWCLAI